MDSLADLHSLKYYEPSCILTDLHLFCILIRRQQRYIWTICAATSLLTSKYLFVDCNIHYPVHIHLLQLAVTAGYLLWYHYWWGHDVREGSLDNLTRSEWIFLIVTTSVMALSIGSTFQAIVHFPNATTLAMLLTVSCLLESTTLLLNVQSIRFKDYIWCIAVILSCAGIMVGEYRLLVKGIQSSLIATIFAGIARALYSIATENHPSMVASPQSFNLVFCTTSIAIAIIWLSFIEDTWWMMLGSLRWKHIPLLVLNVISTSAAIVTGKSILFPVLAAESSIHTRNRNESRTSDVATIVVLAGIIGLLSMFTLRRSYTTFVQFGAFFAAIACIGGCSLIKFIQGIFCNVGDDYRMAPPSSPSTATLRSMDSDRTAVSEDTDWSDGTQFSEFPPHGKQTSLFPWIVTGIIIAFWVVFLTLNFGNQLFFPHPRVKPMLDLSYNATVQHEIVISMYKEPVADVRSLINSLRNMPHLSSARVHIYIKDPDANLENIRRLTNANNITLLPNIGREGETYLNHILTKWESLARQTFFLQARVHNPREFYPRIQNYFDPDTTGMLDLGWSGNVCDCHDCADRWRFDDRTNLFPQIHSRINNKTECTNVLLSYKGQFVVSAARIRGIEAKIYHDLREAFVNEKSWAHQKEFLQGRPDSMHDPEFGYTMERMWNLLFQCSDMDVAWKCPTLLSRWRIGGDASDCQCYDRKG